VSLMVLHSFLLFQCVYCLYGIVEVEIDELQTDNELVRIAFEITQFRLYESTLLLRETAFFQGLHDGCGERFETGLANTIVRWIVPYRSCLDVAPCHYTIVNKRQPLMSFAKQTAIFLHALLECLQMDTHSVIGERIRLRFESGIRQSLVNIFLQEAQLFLHWIEIWRWNKR